MKQSMERKMTKIIKTRYKLGQKFYKVHAGDQYSSIPDISCHQITSISRMSDERTIYNYDYDSHSYFTEKEDTGIHDDICGSLEEAQKRAKIILEERISDAQAVLRRFKKEKELSQIKL